MLRILNALFTVLLVLCLLLTRRLLKRVTKLNLSGQLARSRMCKPNKRVITSRHRTSTMDVTLLYSESILHVGGSTKLS